MFHWKFGPILGLIILTLIVKSEGQQDDPRNELVHHTLTDKTCRMHNTYIECIKKCTDRKEVDTWWTKNDKPKIVEHIKNLKDKGEDPFSCMVKCETHPVEEICRRDCPPPIPFITNCKGNIKEGEWDCLGTNTTFKEVDCYNCYISSIDRNEISICLNDRPDHKQKCKQSVKECMNHAISDTIEKVEECFYIKRMEDDTVYCNTMSTNEPCYDPVSKKPQKSVECDDSCKKFLAKEYCERACTAVKNIDSEFDKCLIICDTKTHPLCKDACLLEDKCINDCKNTTAPNPKPTITCFSKCKGRVEEKILYGTSGQNFSGFHAELCSQVTAATFNVHILIPDQDILDLVFPGTINWRGFNWIFRRLLPEECKAKCPTAKKECQDEFCKTDLTDMQIKELCYKDPFRRQSTILYAAADKKSLVVDQYESSFTSGYKGYVYDEVDTTRNNKFITSLQTYTSVDCNKTCTEDDQISPGRTKLDLMMIGNAECNYNCFFSNRHMCTYEPSQSIELTDFSSCRWKADLSLTNTPDRLTASYFNEKVAYDQKDKLLRPNSEQYLEQTMIGNETHGSKGYFVFPYFVIIRADCDGGFYDEAFYRIFMHGGYPSVHLQYWPTTARDEHQSTVKGTFRSALINLKRNPEHIMVPENPLEKEAGSPKGCHWEICYPAFAVPLLLYRLPIFEVTVTSEDVFSSFFKKIYVSSFNNRDTEGSGSLTITDANENSGNLVLPKMLFPKERVTMESDQEFASLKPCFLNEQCPPVTPANKDDPIHEFLPLDGDDIFQTQFTFLTAPVIAITGFYNPDLLIVGDPDMENFDIVKWIYQNPEQNASIFDVDYQCLQGRTASGYPKPMYTQTDLTDPSFPLKYGRVRLDPRDYSLVGKKQTHGIFDLIALEDRFLILTTSGLVVFYGDTNDTLQANRHFKSFEKEKVRKCFKFVRIAQRAQMENDLVVGITHTYNVRVAGSNITSPVDQEIWIGTMDIAGQPMTWSAVSDKGTERMEPSYYDVPGDPSSGDVVPLDPSKQGGLPPDEQADDAKSEVEKICYKAYTEKMTSSKEIQIKIKPGWCEAIDATPVITKHDTIQLLIRMLVYFVGQAYETSPGPSTAKPVANRDVYFYIIASHTLRKSSEQKVLWDITSIIPRIPCTDEHKESVQNVFLFDLNYFTQVGATDNDGIGIGCNNINKDAVDDHIYLTRITYTSTDGGETFVNLRSFPYVDPDLSATMVANKSLNHRIQLMAFDTAGHYAFLTNRRELWIGSTGALHQIRIRPSSGHSMTQTIVSKIKGLQDAIPFTILFDSKDNLFEMVAVLDDNGEVKSIVKRPVPVYLILRNQKLNDEFAKKSRELSNPASSNPPPKVEDLVYDPSKWQLYCPFNSLRVAENYSAVYSRNQIFFFTPPRQHLQKYGRAYDTPALWAYQVSTYSLTWKSFFKLNYTSYARHIKDPDPFKRWVTNKQETSKIGLLKFIKGDPNLDGVLVLPDKNKRVSSSQPQNRIFRFYYMDYSVILRLELTYSIKNDGSIAITDYFTHQISQIQLNVDNANGSLLQIDTEKVPLAHQASIKFKIHISVIKSSFLRQHKPGQHLIPVPIVFHLIGGFGNCVRKKADPTSTDTHSTIVYVGCQPSTDILFNWNATLYSIKFRDKEAHFGQKTCYGNEFVCFFARIPLILHFDIFDITKQNYTPYTGNYIMRVVAGGYEQADLQKNYSLEEQEAYNIPGVSDVSLIWNEWDLEKSQKVDRKQTHFGLSDKNPRKTSKESVLRAGKSAIQWACHTLSPCARISPNWEFQTIYWFRLYISNRDVDDSTLCVFEKEFNIMLYGFPPSPETQLLTTILFCLCMLGILYLLFFCCRGHKRVWRASKVKMYGWYQIVKDTFPKSLKTHEAELTGEGQTQQQKDNIIMSLQGHLKIPPLMGRDSVADGRRSHQRSMSSISHASSNMSITSHYSSNQSFSQQQVLNPIAPRNAATTWTDLVYEQIISKRLTAIVEKNKKMRANILRKASVRIDESVEQEKRYEEEHKRTVSKESVFDGPSEPKKNSK